MPGRSLQGAMLLAGLGAAGCGSLPPTLVAERYELSLDVQADGSVRAVDTLTVPVVTPLTSLERRIDGARVDAFADVVTRLDGESGDAAPGRVDVDAAGPLVVRWRFETPLPAGDHRFTIEYVAAGAVARSGHRGRLEWPVLPLAPVSSVARVIVTLGLPSGVAIYGAPALTHGVWSARAPGESMPGRWMFESTTVDAMAPATLAAEFSVDGLPLSEPDWQRNAALARELAPAWIASAVFVLVTVWGVLLMLRIKFPRAAPAESPSAVVDARLVEQVRRLRRWPPAEARALISAGLVDDERMTTARALRVSGLAVIAMGLIAAALAALLLGDYGAWPYALPLSVVLAGLWLAWAGFRFRTLTPLGERLRLDGRARVPGGRAQ